MPLFSQADLDALSGPHVQRAWFVEVYLPSGLRRYHTSLGKANIGGKEWDGVSDPFGGAVVGISNVEEPRFGQAPAIDVVFSGASKPFLKSIWDDKASIEGAQADVYFAVIDSETGDVLIDLKKVFPGKLTAPAIKFLGASIRAVMMKIISVWEGLNFATTGSMWSPAGQRERFPGDKGLDFINSDIIEEYKA
jgi:hypothetical protein